LKKNNIRISTMNFLSVIVVVVILFFGFQYFMMFRMKLKKGKPAPSLSGHYGKAVESGKMSLFYFYSPSCGACRSMTPIVSEYVEKNSRCFKIDVSRDMDTARAFGVMGTPSTIVVEKGIIKDFIVGPRPAEVLTGILEQTQK